MNSIKENLKPRGHMGKTVVFDSEMDYNCFLKRARVIWKKILTHGAQNKDLIF